MSGPLCMHGNFSTCPKCEALDIPEVEELEQGYRARIVGLEEERNTAEDNLRKCRARCERMRTMEGLPLDECAARQLHAEQQRNVALSTRAGVEALLRDAIAERDAAKAEAEKYRAGEARAAARAAAWDAAGDAAGAAASAAAMAAARDAAWAAAGDAQRAEFNRLIAERLREAYDA